MPRPSVGVPTLAALVVAVFAITLSGPLIAYAAAPGLAIACWRNIFAAAVLAPVAVGTRRAELARLAGRSGRPVAIASLLAGLALAVHFATWVPSVKLTGIAAATALVATQPVWQGLIALGQGRRLPAAVWIGIGLAVGGAVLATGADIGFSARAFAGDLLALTGGIAGAVYTVRRARPGQYQHDDVHQCLLHRLRAAAARRLPRRRGTARRVLRPHLARDCGDDGVPAPARPLDVQLRAGAGLRDHRRGSPSSGGTRCRADRLALAGPGSAATTCPCGRR